MPTDVFTVAVPTEELLTEFHFLATEWKRQSRLLSNGIQKAMLQPYQRIIGMGRPVVPLILEDLQREPAHWFWALESITGENPVPEAERGSVPKSVEAWLNWGRQHRLLG